VRSPNAHNATPEQLNNRHNAADRRRAIVARLRQHFLRLTDYLPDSKTEMNLVNVERILNGCDYTSLTVAAATRRLVLKAAGIIFEANRSTAKGLPRN
jgi:hypothetical protein